MLNYAGGGVTRGEELLLRSVSGVRGVVGVDLTPEIALRHAAAFGSVLRGGKVVVASDTRPTGPMIREAAIAGLLAVGCDVIDIGIAPTPTVALAVTRYRAAAGLAVTASHNPIAWNALKFLGSARAILPPRVLTRIYATADSGRILHKKWRSIGCRTHVQDMIDVHIEKILRLHVVDHRAIKRRRPRVVFDAGGGAGFAYGPSLLEKLGCRVERLYCTPGAGFPRGAEPVPKNLRALGRAVRRHRADLGFAVDPDSDRLAIVGEDGQPLGEERTLVLATYWVLSRTPGPVVINLSTTQAVLDVARAFGQRGYTSPVGELNVAVMMKAKRAIIGGEGNGGVIMPVLHPGRDALLGMALVLSLLAHSTATISELSAGLPTYIMMKRTAPRPQDLSRRLKRFRAHFIKQGRVDDRDGIKIELDDGSVQTRPSNTEPIVRVSSEAVTRKRARELVDEAMTVLGF